MTIKQLEKSIDKTIELWSVQLNEIDYDGTIETRDKVQHLQGMIYAFKLLKEQIKNAKKV